MKGTGAIAWSGSTTLFWAGIWVLLDGQFTVGALVFALLLGFATSRLVSRRGDPPRRLLGAAFALIRLGGFFIHELAVSNVQQLRIVLSPRIDIEPRWLEVDTTLETDFGRALLGVLVSMTPGTLTCGFSGSTLLVHVLDAEDSDAISRRIRDRLEAPIARLERFRSADAGTPRVESRQ